jgi:hypothetical protein
VLTKNQALAAMDAQLIRVEAERRQRLERRVGRQRVLFPILRQVPIEDISALVEQARLHTLRQWTFYLVPAAIIAVLSWFVLLRPWLGIGPPIKVSIIPWYFIAMSLMGLTIHQYMRAYLRRAVPLQHNKSHD